MCGPIDLPRIYESRALHSRALHTGNHRRSFSFFKYALGAGYVHLLRAPLHPCTLTFCLLWVLLASRFLPFISFHSWATPVSRP